MSAFDDLAAADVNLLTRGGLLNHVEFWHLLVCPECGSWTSEDDRPCENEHTEPVQRVFVNVVPDSSASTGEVPA